MTQTQTAAPAEVLHSANCGFTVHRTGQLEYAFAAEGGQFAVDLVGYLNTSQHGVITTYLFREVLGRRDRLHWLVHMRSPHDYQRLLQLVDHDRDYQDIATLDRLPTKGGGNWERMFVAGTFRERVLLPQHGFGHPPEGAVDPALLFADPARYQTAQPVEVQLSTANAGAVVLRTGRARYELREQARYFGVDWADFVNRALPGEVTAFLYEEIFGRQDTLHWLVHLRTLDSWTRLEELARTAEYRALMDRQRVPDALGGGTWGRLFEPASLHDTMLVPYS